MAATKARPDLLVGVKPVCEAFCISEDQFYMFLGMGLPMRKINGRWYGHRENLNEFFRRATLPGEPLSIDQARARQLAGGEE